MVSRFLRLRRSEQLKIIKKSETLRALGRAKKDVSGEFEVGEGGRESLQEIAQDMEMILAGLGS